METECNSKQFEFEGFGSRKVVGSFDGGARRPDIWKGVSFYIHFMITLSFFCYFWFHRLTNRSQIRLKNGKTLAINKNSN